MSQIMPQIDNSDAYHTVSWILDNADAGFFIVIASPQMQRKISKIYITPKTAVYDYSHNTEPYSYSRIRTWAQSYKDADVFFLMNMQLAFMDDKGIISEDFMLSFNMSRDLLAKEQKIWIIFMTKEAEYRLSIFAYDIYSYMMQKAYFQDEEANDIAYMQFHETGELHNVAELRKTLLRYNELEDKYMGLSLDNTPENQLLSAAITLSNIALIYKDCAEYDNALNLLEKIKEIREKVLGIEHPDTAAIYNNIALVYNAQGDYDKALEWQLKALEIREKTLKAENPDRAQSYNNIAEVYVNKGENIKALEWYQCALLFYKKISMAEHPKTAKLYNNIAMVYAYQGEYSEALEYNKKALAIQEKILGVEHLSTAATYNNIAVIYAYQGENSKAMEWNQKALTIREKILGTDHPDAAISYINIATVYYNQGNYLKALDLFDKSHEIFLKIFEKTHKYTKTALRNREIVNNAIAIKPRNEKLHALT